MKTFLRFAFFSALIAFSNETATAQCTVSNIVIQNVRVISSTPTTCTVKYDITFNIEDNNGNKLIFIHSWLQKDYPDYFQCVNGQTTRNGSIAAPAAAELINAFENIGIDNTGAVPTILATYPPDASVPMAPVDSINKIVLPDGSANFTLYGVLTTAPVACGTPIVIVADLWSSQSSSGQRAHCVNCGIRYSSDYISVIGLVNCGTLMYGGIITNRTGITIDGYYRVFADVNGDGYFTPTTDTLLQTNTAYTVAPFSTTNISGPVPRANINQNIFVVFTQTTGSAFGASRVIVFTSTQCAPLPVTFKSFNATRTNKTNVLVKWETVTETNNNSFSVQRNMGSNTWETVTVINTLAQAGNSSTVLAYTFNDLNSNRGITQYRIKQTDIDTKEKYSEIRAVRGYAQSGKIIVYPNPSNTGQVNIVFENKEGARDISLSDMSGRIVKQWAGVTLNTIRIDNLVTGMYTLRVIMKETGSQSMEKIVITKF
jgi:Secretion system C-terminal sorting domain